MARGGSRSGVDSPEALAEAMSRLRPASALALGPDGEQTPLALSGSKGKWQRAARVAWDSEAAMVQCADAEGRVLGIIRIAPPAADTPEPDVRAPAPDGLDATTRAILEGQRLALEHQRHLVTLVVDTARAMNALATERAVEAEAARQSMLKGQERALDQAAEVIEAQAAQVAEAAQAVELARVEAQEAAAAASSPVDDLVEKLFAAAGPHIAASVGEAIMAKVGAAMIEQKAGTS